MELFGHFLANGGAGAGSGETESRAGFRHNNVSERDETRRRAAHRRVGDDGDEEQSRAMVFHRRRARLRHLHQGNRSLVHASACAGRRHDHDGQALLDGALKAPRNLFADDGAHAAHDEVHVRDADDEIVALDLREPRQHLRLQPGLFPITVEAVGVTRELQEIDGVEVAVELGERSLIDQQRKTFVRGQGVVVSALWADFVRVLKRLRFQFRLASETFDGFGRRLRQVVASLR